MDVKQLIIYQNIVHFICCRVRLKRMLAVFFQACFFFFYWQGAWGGGVGGIYVSAGNVQQSVLFRSVPSSGLVLVINDKSVLVFLNVTLCDGFVGIRVL